MKSEFQKLFLSSQTLLLAFILSTFSWAGYGALTVLEGAHYDLTVKAAILFVLILGMWLSYRKGETNVQKTLLGALLICLCTVSVDAACELFLRADGSLLRKALAVAEAICFAALFVNHLFAQSDHTGVMRHVHISQALTAVLLVKEFADLLVGCFLLLPASQFADGVFSLSMVLTVLMIVCIDTRIQTYKKLRLSKREKSVWTEEARTEAKEIFKI